MRTWVLANLTLSGFMTVLLGIEYGLWGLLLGVAMWLLGFGMMFEICFQKHEGLEFTVEDCDPVCDCPDHEVYHNAE